MKKRQFFTLALMGAALIFTTSCSDDDGDDEPLGPSLAVSETQSASMGGDIETTPNTALIFAIEARKGENVLNDFTISQNGTNVVNPLPQSYEGNEFPYSFPNTEDDIYVDTVSFNSGSNLGITTYTFTVSDDLGKTSTVSFDVDVVATDVELSDPTPFTWTRVGGNPATGLEQFGLEWTQNSTGGFAIVALDGATEMVELQSSDWTTIQTQDELGVAILNGPSITQYDNVSTDQGDTYDDVLGVSHDGVDYLLHITGSTVTVGGAGTTITISGESKN